MEFREALRRAWEDVSASDIPSSLQSVALEAGIAYYLNIGTGHLPANGLLGGSTVETVSGHGTGAAADPIGAISREIGLPRENIEELIYFDPDGKPGINGGPRRLGPSNAERTRAIALLCAGALHFGTDVVDVPIEIVRAACRQLNVYDQNNFARYLSDVPGFILSGPKDNRVLRAKSDAAVKLRQKIQEVTGGERNE